MSMTILETQIYRGANYWAPMPVIRFLLDIGELEERPTNLIPGFYEHLTTTIPTMFEHRLEWGRACWPAVGYSRFGAWGVDLAPAVDGPLPAAAAANATRKRVPGCEGRVGCCGEK